MAKYLKNPWYIEYHGPNFTSLNKEYKEGLTISKLKLVDNMYDYDFIIDSPDDESFLMAKKGFLPTSQQNVGNNHQIFSDDPCIIISWIFEKLRIY